MRKKRSWLAKWGSHLTGSHVNWLLWSTRRISTGLGKCKTSNWSDQSMTQVMEEDRSAQVIVSLGLPGAWWIWGRSVGGKSSVRTQAEASTGSELLPITRNTLFMLDYESGCTGGHGWLCALYIPTSMLIQEISTQPCLPGWWCWICKMLITVVNTAAGALQTKLVHCWSRNCNTLNRCHVCPLL